MPVRSFNSPLIRWPDRTVVERALCAWAEEAGRDRPELRHVGYFGSYARGDWGVGSDLDVVLIVSAAAAPFHERAAEWDMLPLPVPVDLLVYTPLEWTSVIAQPTRLAEVLRTETVWVWPVRRRREQGASGRDPQPLDGVHH